MTAATPATPATPAAATPAWEPSFITKMHNKYVGFVADWTCCAGTYVRKLEVTADSSTLATIAKIALCAIGTFVYSLVDLVSSALKKVCCCFCSETPAAAAPAAPGSAAPGASASGANPTNPPAGGPPVTPPVAFNAEQGIADLRAGIAGDLAALQGNLSGQIQGLTQKCATAFAQAFARIDVLEAPRAAGGAGRRPVQVKA